MVFSKAEGGIKPNSCLSFFTQYSCQVQTNPSFPLEVDKEVLWDPKIEIGPKGTLSAKGSVTQNPKKKISRFEKYIQLRFGLNFIHKNTYNSLNHLRYRAQLFGSSVSFMYSKHPGENFVLPRPQL